MKRKTIVLAALVGLFLVGGIAWLAMRPAPLTCEMNSSRNMLVIECDDASFEDARDLGVVPVVAGESLQIKGTVNRGSVDVIFTNGTKRLTARLDAGFTEESEVTTREGNWRVRVVPRDSNTKATIRILKRGIVPEPAAAFIAACDGTEVVSDYPLEDE